MQANIFIYCKIKDAAVFSRFIKVVTHGPNPRNGSKTDEAHPPIHPLKFAGPNELVGLEWLLYEFVVRHFLACVSSDAKGQETKVLVSSFFFIRSELSYSMLCINLFFIFLIFVFDIFLNSGSYGLRNFHSIRTHSGGLWLSKCL